MTESQFLASLIQTGYFPSEAPPVLTARYFSKFCESNFAQMKHDRKSLLVKTTKYGIFSAPRANNGRRSLALVHPLAQLNLSLIIAANRKEIAGLISARGTSLYRVSESKAESLAFQSLDFKRWRSVQTEIASAAPFLLCADISRFFYTIYTHSLPWAVIGKEKVKELIEKDRRKLERHWAHQMDAALQRCQSRETFGIPVGPDTSRIVAEILLAGVESDKKYRTLVQERPSKRLMDDFLVGFSEQAQAEQGLVALRHALWKYSLQLNEHKTKIVPSPLYFDERWRLDMESIHLSGTDEAQQERAIHRLIDVTLYNCAQFGTAAPASWACNRLSQCIQFPQNYRLLLDSLFRIARDFPSSLHIVAAFIVNHRSLFVSREFHTRISSWVKEGIRKHLPNADDAETVWFLLVAGAFEISVTEKELTNTDDLPSPLVLASLFLLNEKGLLTGGMSRWSWRARFHDLGVYSEYWLPFYEAVRRKWTKDRKIISAVKKEPVFAKMLKADVTFLEDQVFNTPHIDIKRRTFRRPTIKTSAAIVSGGTSNVGSNKKSTARKTKQIKRGHLTFADIDFSDEFDYG